MHWLYYLPVLLVAMPAGMRLLSYQSRSDLGWKSLRPFFLARLRANACFSRRFSPRRLKVIRVSLYFLDDFFRLNFAFEPA
jgi:hypothetical protein